MKQCPKCLNDFDEIEKLCLGCYIGWLETKIIGLTTLVRKNPSFQRENKLRRYQTYLNKSLIRRQEGV